MGSDDHGYGSGGGGIPNRWAPEKTRVPAPTKPHVHNSSCYSKVPDTEGTGEYLNCKMVAGKVYEQTVEIDDNGNDFDGLYAPTPASTSANVYVEGDYAVAAAVQADWERQIRIEALEEAADHAEQIYQDTCDIEATANAIRALASPVRLEEKKK